MLARLFDGSTRIGGHILRASRAGTILFMVLYGALLVGLSLLLGLHSVTTCDSPGREVGFLAAPNWTITGLAIWPAMYFVLRALLDSADRVFAEIDGSPMTWLAADGERVSDSWAANRRIVEGCVTLALALAIVPSLFEWVSDSAIPLYKGSIPVGVERDWSNLSAIGCGGTARWAQAVFALLAFLYQGLAIAMMLVFAAATILIARTVARHGSGAARPPLLVDIESNDPSKRAGFERFIVPIDHMIAFVGLAFANFFLTRVQNAYLRATDIRSASGAEATLWDFLREDLTVSATQEGIAKLFDSRLDDFSSVAVSIGAVIALFQCFFFFNAALRHAAMQARNRSDHALVRGGPARRAGETGLNRAAVRERLQSANVWPLGYSDLLPTLSFLAISLTTIIFYRIGVYLVFLWIAGWILSRTAAGLLRR